jgi:glycosyltransferase involved in cell wall biosynthesis
MTQASGNYIAFLDSDDVWLPNKLEKSLVVLAQGFDLVSHAIIPLREKVRDGLYSWQECAMSDVADLLYGDRFIATSTVVASREVIGRAKNFSEDEFKITAEDFDFWLRLLSAGARIKIFEDALTLYRIHAASASKAQDLRHLKASLYVLNEHHQNLKNSGKASEIRFRKCRANYFYMHGRQVFLSNQIPTSIPLLKKAVFLNPLKPKYWAALGIALFKVKNL